MKWYKNQRKPTNNKIEATISKARISIHREKVSKTQCSIVRDNNNYKENKPKC